MAKLSDLQVGQSALIENISPDCDKKVKQRLRDMGFVAGEEVLVKKKALFGDPIKIILKNYELTIRKKEADLINIKNV